ncbi:MAG TPA: hypothetical protein VL574_06235 [Stellaceae bacterium]|nr:hypothetical protein [Stellaceae bacterium]
MSAAGNSGEGQFDDLARSLVGLPVGHVWRGYGSALFLEFGALRPRLRRDGSFGNPHGQISLMLEWSWRIEGRRRILCGSWSDKRRWPRVFNLVRGKTVESVTLFGRLAELDLGFSHGLHALSFMTADGDPAWILIRNDTTRTVFRVRHGRLSVESGQDMDAGPDDGWKR